jgi:phage terminase large subunit-like protein
VSARLDIDLSKLTSKLSPQLVELARLTPAERADWLRGLPSEVKARLPWLWEFWARPEQIWRPGAELITLIQAGRGWGKALSLDTRLPTPTGWTTMGTVQIGDLLIDEAGRPCKVTATFEVDAEEAWRIEFSDGQTIDACADHLWVTLTQLERKAIGRRRGSIVDTWAAKKPITTKQLIDTLHRNGERNHCIPVACLHLPQVTLPLDPYVLGVWLGDGDSRDPVITCHENDAVHYAERFIAAGVGWETKPTDGAPHILRCRFGRRSEAVPGIAALRSLGVLLNKHIPASYLRASFEQRLALMQGLIDTDGYVDPPSGKVEFTSTSGSLARDVAELARTLGQKPRIYEGRATLRGVDCGAKWRVVWRPTVQVASLPRKVAAIRPAGAQDLRNRHRMIVGATPLPRQRMRCVTVDSPRAMYLAGEGMIPTHNTRVGGQATRWVAEHPEACGFGKPPLGEGSPIIALVARTAHDAIATMIEGQSGILACSPPWFKPKFYPSKKMLLWPNGMRAYYFTAEKPETLRGPNIGWVWADEVAFFRQPRNEGGSALDNIEQALRKGLARAVYTTTPLPVKAMFDLHDRAKGGEVRIVRGSSLDNAANQAARWIALQRAKMGTRLGRQEVLGELLSGNPRTLFPFELLNNSRVDPDEPVLPGESPYSWLRRVLALETICVAADPAGSSSDDAAEFGIVVVGRGRDGHEYALEDLSGHHDAYTWPRIIYDAALLWGVDAIVAEVNYGGEMIEAAINTYVRSLVDRHLPYLPIPFVAVRAKGGKASRLAVMAQAYELGLCHHVGRPDKWAPLEAQLHAFDPSRDPDDQVARVEITLPSGIIVTETLRLDRMDARVWAHLFLSGDEQAAAKTLSMLGGGGAADLLGSIR